MNTWFETWFNTPYYHQLYKNRNQEEAEKFISNLLSYLRLQKASKLCDLACGKGRHAIQMHKAGFNVTGLDLSVNSINYAKQFETNNLNFYVHDMRNAFGANRFHFISNLFTSFGYFSSKKTNLKVLQNIYLALVDKGILVIDFINVDAFLHLFPMKEQKNIDAVLYNIYIRLEDGIIIKDIEIVDGDSRYQFEERLQALTKNDFEEMINEVGFKINALFGSYDLGKYTKESKRLILVLEK